MAAWTGWAGDLLAALGDRSTPDNLRFLDTWHSYEQSACANNPLNTTEPWAGATRCNSVGVKNYPSRSAGIAATAATLRNGRYNAILEALRDGSPYLASDPAVITAELDTWGSHSFAVAYYEKMGGTATTPVPSAPIPQPAAQKQRQVGTAWTRLMRTLAHTAPAELRRVSAATAQLRKGVR